MTDMTAHSLSGFFLRCRCTAGGRIKQTHLPESIWKGLPSLINLSFSIVKVGAAAALAAAHRQKSPKSKGDMVDNRKQRSGLRIGWPRAEERCVLTLQACDPLKPSRPTKKPHSPSMRLNC